MALRSDCCRSRLGDLVISRASVGSKKGESVRFAIVGAAIRLPGVADLEEFRCGLAAGTVSLEQVSDADARTAGASEALLADPRYVPVATVLEDTHLFDRERFGMTAGEARWTDPQQRLLLTLADEALECSGLDVPGERVGVIASTSTSTYLADRAPEMAVIDPHNLDLQAFLGSDRDFSASRVAFRLGLRGPAMAVHSACSSSLVALHNACSTLAMGDADAMVVGAVSMVMPQRHGYISAPGGVLSPTGTSRPFDVASDGTVRGTGGAAVVVRRLEDALTGEEPILAVVAGTAVNNDGPGRMGFSSPSAAGQEDVLRRALERSGVDPDRIGYVEAHGTGTPLGDPVELRALGRAYANGGGRVDPCGLGSVKANCGHLDVAAGLVGLLKVVLVLREDTHFVQPSFDEPNPALRLDETPFFVPTETRTGLGLTHASVSSFGMGGTNAHAVLEAAPGRAKTDLVPRSEPTDQPRTVTLSAADQTTLTELLRTVSRHLALNPQLPLDAVVATLGRRPLREFSSTVTASSTAELARKLAAGVGTPETPPATGHTTLPVATRRVWLPPTPAGGEDCSLPDRERVQLHKLGKNVQADAATPEASSGEMSSDPRAILLGLISEDLGVTTREETDYFGAGGDSLGLVDILNRWQDLTGTSIPLEAIEGATTVGDLLDACLGVTSADEPYLDIGNGSPRLVAYPPAGGSTFCYSALAAERHDLGFRALRARRDEIDIVGIARRCVEALGDVDPVGGHVLGGYSFGGNVAVEIARQLEQVERPVRAVVLVDAIAPAAFSSPEGRVEEMATEVESLVATAALDADDRARSVIESTEDSRAQDFHETWVSNTRAIRNHRPATSISAPIMLLRADTPLPAAQLEALGIDYERSADWEPLTTGGTTHLQIPGDHYTILTERRNRTVLAATLATVLADLRAGHPEPSNSEETRG